MKELYCRYYFHHRPTSDLLRQASGEAPIEHIKPEMDVMRSNVLPPSRSSANNRTT